jgi:alkaline phosphatase D
MRHALRESDAQLQWLQAQLAQSRATWKIIASDQPLGLIVGDGERSGVPLYEAWANGDGPPRGRELELARLLSFIKHRRSQTAVWITADVHYAAAHEFDPRQAMFTDFRRTPSAPNSTTRRPDPGVRSPLYSS